MKKSVIYLRNYKMTIAGILSALFLWLVVFTLSDSSWVAFKSTFPAITKTTAGPYFILLAGLLLGISIKRAFSEQKLNDNESDRLESVGLLLSALASILIALPYSFLSINETISLKYFILAQVTIYGLFYGGFHFLASLKAVDKQSTSTMSRTLEAVHALKLALTILPNQVSIDEDTKKQIALCLNDLQSASNGSTTLDPIINLEKLLTLLEQSKLADIHTLKIKKHISTLKQT